MLHCQLSPMRAALLLCDSVVTLNICLQSTVHMHVIIIYHHPEMICSAEKLASELKIQQCDC